MRRPDQRAWLARRDWRKNAEPAAIAVAAALVPAQADAVALARVHRVLERQAVEVVLDDEALELGARERAAGEGRGRRREEERGEPLAAGARVGARVGEDQPLGRLRQRAVEEAARLEEAVLGPGSAAPEREVSGGRERTAGFRQGLPRRQRERAGRKRPCGDLSWRVRGRECRWIPRAPAGNRSRDGQIPGLGALRAPNPGERDPAGTPPDSPLPRGRGSRPRGRAGPPSRRGRPRGRRRPRGARGAAAPTRSAPRGPAPPRPTTRGRPPTRGRRGRRSPRAPRRGRARGRSTGRRRCAASRPTPPRSPRRRGRRASRRAAPRRAAAPPRRPRGAAAARGGRGPSPTPRPRARPLPTRAGRGSSG